MATDTSALRRYLLGALDDEACEALEREYFARQDVFDAVWAAENDLVDDYVTGRIDSDERLRFERHYLATPGHQARVAVARELNAAASAAALGASGASPFRRKTTESTSSRDAIGAFLRWPATVQAAAVAALVVLAAGGVWMLRSRPVPQAANRETPAPGQPVDGRAPDQARPVEGPTGRTAPALRGAPVVVAVSLSPISVRGADEPAILTMTAGTDLVALRLESEPNGPAFRPSLAVVRTVAGTEVWRGAAVLERGSPPSARVEVPAGSLPPDDYIVALFEAGANGRESEIARYFLRVRAQ